MSNSEFVTDFKSVSIASGSCHRSPKRCPKNWSRQYNIVIFNEWPIQSHWNQFRPIPKFWPSWPKIRSKFQKRISMKNWNLTNILLCTYIFWNYYFSTSRQAKISAINKVKILYYFIIFMEIYMVLFHTGRQATYSLVSDQQASKNICNQ